MLKTTLPSVSDEESESSHVCCTTYTLPEMAVDLICPGLVDVKYHLLLLSGVVGGGGGVMLSALSFGF